MKKKSPKIHHFYDEVYRQNYYVLKAAKPDALVKFAESMGDILDAPTSSEFTACVWTTPESGIYIWISRIQKDQSSTIAHECAHAAIATFLERGIPITYDSEEPFCYYLQYLVQQVTRACQVRL